MTRGLLDPEPYVAWAIAGTPSIVGRALGEGEAAHQASVALRDAIRQRSDPAWAEGYRRARPVAGVDADAYRLREVVLEGDARVLAGIHFRGGDVLRPFVGVLAQTRDLTPAERFRATRPLCDTFAGFAPAAVWWWVASVAAPVAEGARVVADKRLLIGVISDLVGDRAESVDVPFALNRDRSGASYDPYAAMFDAFIAAHPVWRGRLPRSERADYQACANAGGLFVAEFGGRIEGVFAARPDQVQGIPGWLVEEEFLGAALRGRGLAPALQRMALAHLDTRDRPLVLGTILADNEPSLRTARRVGRSDVGGWAFVLDGRRSASWLV
ncbi:MAG: hypothetical protein EA416_13295 [Trueperaceae bacterium]|nr:MAG: hypothetical protein EA416_13295 [Trueperaceae bacterium]